MKTTLQSAYSLLAAALLYASPSAAQTYSNCNPLTSGGSCPPDSALGKSVNIDFNSASDSFTPQGNPTYSSNGVALTIAKSGDAPMLTSKWYIMFGQVEFTMQAATGAGIVSSVVMQSDDLDEIDWEFLGAQPDQVQTNYFGKGQTGTYNRESTVSAPGDQTGMHTYTLTWTDSQITWQVNGQTVRTLTPDQASGQYPQTPMQLKLGAWAGGDPSEPQGTIAWAMGPTDYSKGPFTMTVQNLKVTDYSTGTQYTYGGTAGTWQSITAVGGTVNGNANGASNPPPSSGSSADPPATTGSSNEPMPFSGTHKDSTAANTQTGYPWVASTTLATSAATTTPSNYPGLPSGWTVTSSGKVVPPSSGAATTLPPSGSSFSPAPSSTGGSPGGASTASASGFKTTSASNATSPRPFTQSTAAAGHVGASPLAAAGGFAAAFIMGMTLL